MPVSLCAKRARLILAPILLLGSAHISPHAGWSAEASSADAIERGQELFERSWQPGHRPVGMMDGLGPLFNERSCIACHDQGGIGGAGPLDKNVDLITAEVPRNEDKRQTLNERLTKLHPGFRRGWSIVLHRFNSEAADYNPQREQLLGIKLAPNGDLLPGEFGKDDVVGIAQLVPYKRLVTSDRSLTWTTRNTTPLFGMGLIDKVPNTYLAQVAETQRHENHLVTGRVLGKFGWRGQSASLLDFVRGACAAELGLEPEFVIQGASNAQVRNTFQPRGFDLSSEDCQELTDFVANLPAPRRLAAIDSHHAAQIERGEKRFDSVGCAVCHRPQLASINGIYSDLLLHDMGERLSDPSPAPEKLSVIPSSSLPTYYGADLTPTVSPGELRVLTREWKTPPLWGVRDSGPYLHDGRAATLEEAITWHAGEANLSVKRFARLSANQKGDVVAFLMSLAAPDPRALPKRIYANEVVTAEPPAHDPATFAEYRINRP